MIYYRRNFVDLARSQHIFDSIKASLERLQLDYVDVLQCKLSTGVAPFDVLIMRVPGHRFDYTTPIEETASKGSSMSHI